MMTASRPTIDIVRAVLKIIKTEVVSRSDFISRTELPYCFAHEMKKYVEKYGERFIRMRECEQRIKKIREKAKQLYPTFKNENIPCPITTMNIAVTLCGVGECGETSNRAAVELVKAGCTQPINIIVTLGKTRTPFPKSNYSIEDHYEHAFVIIGKLPKRWDVSLGLDAFKELNEDCILLDPSLGIIGKAKDTQILLKDIFSVYEINRFGAEVVVIEPKQYRAVVDEIFKNAREISKIIKHDLQIEQVERIPAACLSTNQEEKKVAFDENLTPLRMKIFDIKKSKRPKILSSNELMQDSGFKSDFCFFKPSSLLVDKRRSNGLSWEESNKKEGLFSLNNNF